MAAMKDAYGPERCSCGSDWTIRVIEIKVDKDIVEIGRYWCKRCDLLKH